VNQRRLAYAALAVLAAAAWWEAQRFGNGPGLLPRLAGVTLGVLCLAGLFERTPLTAFAPGPATLRPLAVLASFALYGALMPLLGFLVTTTGLAVGLTLAFGGAGAWRWALAAAAFAGLVYVVFGSLFAVNFPAGIAR
jgi:hypothetical protein